MLGLAAAAVAAGAAIPASYLTVTGEDGARLWTVAIAPGTPVTLAYENSIYHAQTEEILTATSEGFLLHRVRSTSEAVLAYNGLDAPYRRRGAWYEAEALRPLPVLTVRIGRTGRQFLKAGDRILPLYAAGEGARLQVVIEQTPRAVAALRAWGLR